MTKVSQFEFLFLILGLYQSIDSAKKTKRHFGRLVKTVRVFSGGYSSILSTLKNRPPSTNLSREGSWSAEVRRRSTS